MKDSLTHSMNWLHSWSGLLFGWLLYAVFFTGTFTVFDNEITSWMQPELQEVTSDASDPGEAVLRMAEMVSRVDPRGGDDLFNRPQIRLVKSQKNRMFSGQTIDPATGKLVTFRDTQGGDFFYHFHHGLLLGTPGAWTVGAAGMVMLVALVTGLGIHRRMFKDLFVVRPQLFPQRAWLNAHNRTGILILPFHFMVTFTGLMIFWSIYMPAELQFLSGGGFTLSLFSDLHFVRFGGTVMRWGYFLMGLAASAMIASGLVLWTLKRRKYHAEHSQPLSFRIVESFNVAMISGLVVAVSAFFWANRVLPIALPERSLWEVRCFFFVWCLCLVHSLLRGGSIVVWKQQLYGAAFLSGFLPVLNGLTTDSHLFMTLPKGKWALAGFDLTALAAGVVLWWAARRVGQVALKMSNGRIPPISLSNTESEQI